MLDLSSTLVLFFTLAVMSLVFKENRAYRFAEYTFVGFATAHGLLIAISYLQNNVMTPLVRDSKYLFLIPVALGLILFTKLHTRTKWASRYTISLLVGVAMGISITTVVQTDLVNQIRASIIPLNTFENITQVVCVITVLYFFFMTKWGKATEILKPVATLGRYLMMMGLGASFGSIVMSRLTMLAGRVLELLRIVGLA